MNCLLEVCLAPASSVETNPGRIRLLKLYRCKDMFAVVPTVDVTGFFSQADCSSFKTWTERVT